MILRNLDIITPKEFYKMIQQGINNKRTTTFFILQVTMALIFGILYYLSVLFDEKVLGIKIQTDDMHANIFEALHFSLITQTTVGYSGGYTYLSDSGKFVNFLHLFSMLAVFVLI